MCINHYYKTFEISIAFQRDTCSWKGKMEKTRSWKVRHEMRKNEVGKFGLKLESTTEVGKGLMKLESFDLTCKKST